MTKYRSKEAQENEKKRKRRWYLKNRERLLKLNLENYYANRDHYAKMGRAWQKANAEAICFARKMGIGVVQARELMKQIDERKANGKARTQAPNKEGNERRSFANP